MPHAKKAKRRPAADDGQEEGEGAWVLATYHCYYSVQLLFVVRGGGKPMADWHPTSARDQAYRWNSYHAARKFQRTHTQLRGYVILNLSELEQQAEAQREIREEWIRGSRSA